MDFKDKVVIVTGSSSGIGAVTALLFSNYSAKLVIVGRNQERLNDVARKVESAKGIKPLVIKVDLKVDSDVKKVIDETVKHFGRIDILVNNAGVAVLAGIRDGIEHFDDLISTNLRSIYLITELVTPYLIKTKGNIVNVSSVAGVKILPEYAAYCISKAGLDMLTKISAKELAADGVRVNSVSPGPVKTNFHAAYNFTQAQIDDSSSLILNKSPLGYDSTSEEVAEYILFLVSDKARSITGTINFIDNGRLLV